MDMPKKIYIDPVPRDTDSFEGVYYGSAENVDHNDHEYIRADLVNELIEACETRQDFKLPEPMFADVEGTIKILEDNNSRVRDAVNKLKALEAE